MHPEIARELATQHRDELVCHAARARHPRRFPRWHVSWTKAAMTNGTPGRAGGRGSSLMIIISAHRPA